MLASTEAQHYFETDASQALRARRSAKAGNRYGSPVVLKSKLLAVLADPTSPAHVFVAESAATARRVHVDTGDAQVFRGPTAPVTCLALGGAGGRTLFAGSWDKTVWSFDRDTQTPGRRYAAGGHTDFVKAVVCGCLGGDQHVLISGGADKKIFVWDVASGCRLHTLQDQSASASNGGGDRPGAMMAVQHLAIDPVATTRDEIWLVSASSDPHIRRWRVRRDGWEQVVEAGDTQQTKQQPPTARTATTLRAHETTVYKLVFEDGGGGDYDYDDDDDDDDDDDAADLWTASADGTAKRLARRHGFRHQPPPAGRQETANVTTLAHGSHVRAVAVTDAWVVTAGRDEDLQYWERGDGGDGGGGGGDGELEDETPSGSYATFTGHYDEVTDLAVLADGRRLCSVSLDGTVRTWPLAKAAVDALAEQQRQDAAAAAAGGGDGAGDDEEEAAAGALTAEEEAELAALMED